MKLLMVKRFLRDEAGQDLIEYTLLMAFIALASAALIANLGMSVAGIWNKGNSTLSTAVISSS
jgi:Flp pilus assembly pilin Flp